MASLAPQLRLASNDEDRAMSTAIPDQSVPRVSVVVPAWNAERFIEVTLATALGQTFSNIEIVVIDDGSKDQTAAVVHRIAASDSRVRLIQQSNTGLAGARNRGIRESCGELIAFLDHDDLWHPDKLALQVALLDSHPLAGLASCYSAVIDEEHRCLGWRFGGSADGNVYDEVLVWDMISGGSVAVIRRAAFDIVGQFDESLPMRSDWDMWIRIARHFHFATVPRTLVGYTRSKLGLSRGYDRMAEAGKSVLEKARRDDPAFNGYRFRFCRARDLFAVACVCTIDGEIPRAWSYLRQCLALTPMPVLTSPRRCALVLMLMLRTVLPASMFRSVLGAMNVLSFRLQPGSLVFGGTDSFAT